MSTYVPRPGVFAGRPPCATCGANYRLHHPQRAPAGRVAPPRCPEPYRPATLEAAQRELTAAEASADPARVFVARGEVQRLQGRPPGPRLIRCECHECELLQCTQLADGGCSSHGHRGR